MMDGSSLHRREVYNLVELATERDGAALFSPQHKGERGGVRLEAQRDPCGFIDRVQYALLKMVGVLRVPDGMGG